MTLNAPRFSFAYRIPNANMSVVVPSTGIAAGWFPESGITASRQEGPDPFRRSVQRFARSTTGTSTVFGYPSPIGLGVANSATRTTVTLWWKIVSGTGNIIPQVVYYTSSGGVALTNDYNTQSGAGDWELIELEESPVPPVTAVAVALNLKFTNTITVDIAYACPSIYRRNTLGSYVFTSLPSSGPRAGGIDCYPLEERTIKGRRNLMGQDMPFDHAFPVQPWQMEIPFHVAEDADRNELAYMEAVASGNYRGVTGNPGAGRWQLQVTQDNPRMPRAFRGNLVAPWPLKTATDIPLTDPPISTGTLIIEEGF